MITNPTAVGCPVSPFFASTAQGGILHGEERAHPAHPDLASCGAMYLTSALAGWAPAAGSDPTVTGEAGISDFRIEQAPGHGTNFVEEFESGGGLGFVDGTGLGEKSEMGGDKRCQGSHSATGPWPACP